MLAVGDALYLKLFYDRLLLRSLSESRALVPRRLLILQLARRVLLELGCAAGARSDCIHIGSSLDDAAAQQQLRNPTCV